MFDDILQAMIKHAARYAEVKRRLDDCQRFLVDYYHIVECVNMSGPATMKLNKRLKEVMRERRELKQEYSKYQSFYDKLKPETVTNAVNNAVKAGQDVDKIYKEAHNKLESLLRETS